MSDLIAHAASGNLKAVRHLIKAGADVNAQNQYGQTALIRASREGHLEIVKALIETGANLNLQGQAEWTTEEGWTALIHASWKGRLEVVKSLVDAGADVNLKTKGGMTALVSASEQGHKEVVKVLEAVESRKSRDSDPSYMSNLIDHASRGNLRAVRDLIDAGADLNLQDKDGVTALMYASDNNHLKIVRILVGAGANINLKTKDKQTALMGVCWKGHLEVVKALVDAGADLNLQDKDGDTALVLASKEGYLEIVKILIDAGADLNLQDKYGNTATFWALKRGHKKVVTLLQAAQSRAARNSGASDRRSLMMFTSLFTALGYLSKVDGKVSQEEIDFVANLMNEMQLDVEQRRQAEDLFRMGKQAPTIALIALFSNLKNEYKKDSESLHELMKTFMQLVYLDNGISEQGRFAIKEIATQLGIAQSVLDAIEVLLLSKSKDNKRSTSSSQNQYSKKGNQSNDSKLVNISANLFEISGYLAKLDGRISREEIKAITNLMDEMQLERDQRCQAEDLFRRGKQASEENMTTLVNNLQSQYSGTPEVLNILVMILMEVAYSDGDMTDPEQQMIRTIAMQLNLDEVVLNIIKAVVYCELQNIRHLDLHDAYKIIGISDAASHRDIKQAYHNLLKTYHPDALQSKGLPKEMLVFGKRLSQTFNLAYDRIKRKHF